MSKGLQIAVGGLLVVLLLGWYGWSQLEGGAFVYYQTLDEFLVHGTPGEPARVHGYVAIGSIERDVEGRQVRFRVQTHPPHAAEAAPESHAGAGAGGLSVVYASLETPDLFKDGAEVVVEGRLSAAEGGAFHATNLLAKCPSKFEGLESPAAASL